MDTLLTEIMIFMGTAGKLPNERGRSFDLKNIMAGSEKKQGLPHRTCRFLHRSHLKNYLRRLLLFSELCGDFLPP
jgi:hypothetical protein